MRNLRYLKTFLHTQNNLNFTQNYNRKSGSETLKYIHNTENTFEIPNMYMKNSNIPNIHKTFNIIRIPNWVSDRTRNRTKTVSRRKNQLCTLP